MTRKYDIVIIGAGAAGLAAGSTACQNGRNVAIVDMGDNVARKVMAAGGGRCNFTNASANVTRYFGENPDFVRGALSRTTPSDILEWAHQHGIIPIEKAAGQYFSQTGSIAVLNALKSDVRDADIFTSTTVTEIAKTDSGFMIKTTHGDFCSTSLVITTGGTSFGTLGVSDFGMKIAKQFGHRIVPPRPALCAIATKLFSPDLAGISVNVEIKMGKHIIRDSMLFTHFGIGGPATYRVTVRDMADDIHINLLPDIDAYEWLRMAKQTNGRRGVSTILGEKLPARIARFVAGTDSRNIADLRDIEIRNIATRISDIVIPQSDIKLHNLAMAEVVRGGIDTRDVSSKTMESKLCPGLFFAGEVLDIAGDLGGFNLHWAWASGRVAGENA